MSIETGNRMSITLCKVSCKALVRLNEHEHNALQTLREYQGSRLEHSSKFVSRHVSCQLGHVHIFNSMFTSLCVTTNVVIFDVSLDVASVFYIIMMLCWI